MKNAILELNDNNINLIGIVDKYIKSNKTYIDNKTLYFKNIPEGLFYLIHYKNGTRLNLTNNFKVFGTMIDVSRGAVFKVDYIKKLIRKKALMGINELWIYIEDIYKIDNYSHFGYLRGSYSLDELEEIVSYADIFGVKIIPTIQTLGHMEQFLKWQKSSQMMDQPNVLMVRKEETYQLINSMFKTLRKVFKHGKIHVGLDETWGFGFGNFYKHRGYVPQMNLFFEHLNKVNEIAEKNGFNEVLIWSDMPYRIMSKSNYYYDYNIEIDDEIINKIPENIKLVYWDYYNYDYDRVDKMLENHKKITDKIVFASGTWIWTRFTYDKKQTDLTTPKHIKASIKNNVQEFILTQWMDDGAYGDHETTLYGVYEQSIIANTNNKPCNLTYKEIRKESLEISRLRTKLHETKMSQVGLMWDDHQFSLYLANFVKNDINNYGYHLKELEELLKIYKDDKTFNFEYNIISANYYKVKGRYMMLKSYMQKKKIESSKYFQMQIKHLEELINIYRNKWYTKYKMNGFEVIQARLSQQIIRAKEMIKLEDMYNKGEITKIDGLLDSVEVYDENLSLKHSYIAYTTKPM